MRGDPGDVTSRLDDNRQPLRYTVDILSRVDGRRRPNLSAALRKRCLLTQRQPLNRTREHPLPQEKALHAFLDIFDALGDGVILHDLESGRVVAANPAACTLFGYPHAALLGRTPAAYLPPEGVAQMAAWIAAVRDGGSASGTLRYPDGDAPPLSFDIHATRCLYDERPALLSVVRDVSERAAAERRLRHEVAARRQEHADLRLSSQTFAATLELKPAVILDELRRLVAYDRAILFLLQTKDLVAASWSGYPQLTVADPLHVALPALEPWPDLLTGRQPTLISDVAGDSPQPAALRALLSGEAALLLDGVGAWMWVPMAVEGRMTGLIGLARREPPGFTTHQADLALTVANQASMAMVNTQLYQQAQAAAALQERQRLAQNLHDAVNQSLFSATLIAEVLPRVWERDVEVGRRSLEDLRRLTRGAMAEMRALLAELRPLVLTDSDLRDLLRQLGDALTGRTDISVALSVTGKARSLPSDVQVAIYRLCQEALSNVGKHAQAQHVTIALAYGAADLRLYIEDDGSGFDLAALHPGRHGLGMMRERAAAIGAALQVTSRPGGGTRIMIQWPDSTQMGGT